MKRTDSPQIPEHLLLLHCTNQRAGSFQRKTFIHSFCPIILVTVAADLKLQLLIFQSSMRKLELSRGRMDWCSSLVHLETLLQLNSQQPTSSDSSKKTSETNQTDVRVELVPLDCRKHLEQAPQTNQQEESGGLIQEQLGQGGGQGSQSRLRNPR
ncbi:hypothetical protein CRENBAI_007002 [Crenichthys baileyi]|uniref:Uncharacterized protein n=1 Tax=Crenichthys baileyi TaxID=28760 RepID=A0AAV9RU24_9TELE